MKNIIVANVHQKKKKAATTAATTTKTNNKKKKPIKVVYISNPKRFNISATQFRALVQELTGQDSDPAKFVDPHHQKDDKIAGSKIDGGDHSQVLSLDNTSTTSESTPDLPSTPPPPPPPPLGPQLFTEPFDEYDDAFMPPHHHHQHHHHEDNLSGFLFSDFSHVDLLMREELMQCK